MEDPPSSSVKQIVSVRGLLGPPHTSRLPLAPQDLTQDHGPPECPLLHQRASRKVSEREECGDRLSGEAGGEDRDKEEDHCRG